MPVVRFLTFAIEITPYFISLTTTIFLYFFTFESFWVSRFSNRTLISPNVSNEEKREIAEKLAFVESPHSYSMGYPTPVELPKSKESGL